MFVSTSLYNAVKNSIICHENNKSSALNKNKIDSMKFDSKWWRRLLACRTRAARKPRDAACFSYPLIVTYFMFRKIKAVIAPV